MLYKSKPMKFSRAVVISFKLLLTDWLFHRLYWGYLDFYLDSLIKSIKFWLSYTVLRCNEYPSTGSNETTIIESLSKAERSSSHEAITDNVLSSLKAVISTEIVSLHEVTSSLNNIIYLISFLLYFWALTGDKHFFFQ